MGQHKNGAQVEIFVNFMEKHKDLARGFVKGDRVYFEQLWEELASQLNASGPPTKEVPAWKKVWIDMKLGVKQRLAHNKVECGKTGGGRFNKYVLSPIDEHIAVICGLYTSVAGIPNAKSFGVPRNESPTTSAGAAKTQETLCELAFSAFTSYSPSMSPVQQCQSEKQAPVALNPTTSVSSSTRKRHIKDPEDVTDKRNRKSNVTEVGDVMKMETEQFSRISKNIADIRKELEENRIYLREISRNIRDNKKLKEKEIEELKRHHFVTLNQKKRSNIDKKIS